jgi:hypothetical protein
MSIKTKSITGIILLSLIDIIIPIPILGLILIYVLFEKPPWFYNVIGDIYKKE